MPGQRPAKRPRQSSRQNSRRQAGLWLLLALAGVLLMAVGGLRALSAKPTHVEAAGAWSWARPWHPGAASSVLLPARGTAVGRPTIDGATSPAVALVRLQPAGLTERLPAVGNVAAWQELTVTSEVSGLRLLHVPVQTGSKVRAGDVLAEFDTRMLKAELAQTVAQLDEARANTEQAVDSAQRAQRLKDTGVVSDQQLMAHRTAERAARARQAGFEAALALQRLQLARATLVATDDGLVASRLAVEGAVPAAGQELFRLIRKGRLEWRAELGADDLDKIQAGQPVTLALGNSTLRGVVRQVAPTVDLATRNGLVQVDLPAHPGLRPGMFLRGEFEWAAQPGWRLPLSSLVLRDGQPHVVVVDAASRARFTPVTVGRRWADQVLITAGPGPDAAIVGVGAGLLTEGEVVRPLAVHEIRR